ncbi:hypothetical protein [Streptomyces sp. CB03238]|uniref:hypothetical protein n=1 Tax=Streptomyces sp. CB03238 TaxID=1907777 RepID=UPI001F4DA918|nr:hypothetical protein [Streptomyces sp. CB03238]
MKETIEWYADKHGTTDGYLLRHPKDSTRAFPYYYLGNQWQKIIKKADPADIPQGMVLYSFRHFFASNCLTHGIPITDVAEWMGHRSLDIHLQDLPAPHARLHRKSRQDAGPRSRRLITSDPDTTTEPRQTSLVAHT